MKVLAVFLKELLVLYIINHFLQKPNFFKFLYLGIYLIYFTTQIQSLSVVFKQFRLNELLRVKIDGFKNYYLSKGGESEDEKLYLFDNCSEEASIVYYSLFSAKIFN